VSFSEQIAAFSDRSQQRIQNVRRGVVMKLFSSVILDTPVDTGRLRGNWQVSEGDPIKTTTARLDKSGQGPISEVNAVAAQSDGDVSIYLTNNLPYAGKIEFEGYSGKAPEGMVRRNVARFGRLIKIQLSQK
jgi:hypothetical protein